MRPISYFSSQIVTEFQKEIKSTLSTMKRELSGQRNRLENLEKRIGTMISQEFNKRNAKSEENIQCILNRVENALEQMKYNENPIIYKVPTIRSKRNHNRSISQSSSSKRLEKENKIENKVTNLIQSAMSKKEQMTNVFITDDFFLAVCCNSTK